jgi:hypothetical protein
MVLCVYQVVLQNTPDANNKFLGENLRKCTGVERVLKVLICKFGLVTDKRRESSTALGQVNKTQI